MPTCLISYGYCHIRRCVQQHRSTSSCLLPIADFGSLFHLLFISFAMRRSYSMVSVCFAVWNAGILLQVSAQQFAGSTFSLAYPGISDACTSALNLTINCPAFLADVAIYNDLLSPAQLQALCNNDCSSSLERLQQDIERECNTESDVITSDGVTYPATWVVDHFLLTFNLSCQKDP